MVFVNGIQDGVETLKGPMHGHILGNAHEKTLAIT